MPTNSYNNNSDKNSKKGVPFVYDGGLPFFACVRDYLKDNGYSFSICGGNYGAKCGRCKVRFEESAPLPDAIERKLLSPDELRDGVRLACRCKPKPGTKAEILFGQRNDIVSDFETPEPEYMPDRDVVGIDLGTTTVAIAFYDSSIGRLKEIYKDNNPQIKYGSDVISRIDATVKYGRDVISNEILEFLYNGVKKVAGDSFKPGLPIYVAGNTIMLHLLAGEDATGLGEYPFKASFLDEKALDYKDTTFVLLPGVSAFVGADIVSGLVSINMLPSKEGAKGRLFVDLGTNAEIVLWDGNRFYATAAAAGSALSSEVGVGSKGISVLADLLRNGEVDGTGLLLKDRGVMSQKVIRDLQLAKAAIVSGTNMLLKKAGMTYKDIDDFTIAGGFGYYLNMDDACKIGLIDGGIKDKSKSVGNASLLGSLMYDKIRSNLKGIRKDFTTIELSLEPGFEEDFMRQVDF